MTGSYAPPKGILFVEPFTKPLVNGQPLPNANRYFYTTGTLIPATVYQDGALQTPFTQPITADANGDFAPIYLDPSVLYRMQLYNQIGALVLDQDPITDNVLTVASSVLASPITTDSTSLASTGLTVNIPAAGVYAYEFYINTISTAASPALYLEVNFSGSTVAGSLNALSIVGTPAPTGAVLNAEFEVVMTENVPCGVWIRGAIMAASNGTLELQWASGSGSNTIQMNAGSYLLMQPVVSTGVLFKEPQSKPLAASPSTTVMPGSYRLFFHSGTSYAAPAPVYADSGLTMQLSQIPGEEQPSCTADGDGRFNPIYLDPSITYAMQLYSVSGSWGNTIATLVEEIDPYVPRPFEITPAVKLAPTIRNFGAALAADPALQITLNAGVYSLESFLDFVPSASSIDVTGLIWTISGGGTLSGTLVYETNIPSYGFITLAAPATGNFIFDLNAGGAPNASTSVLFKGGITVTGGSATIGLSWYPSTASSGNQVALSPGSTLVAKPLNGDIGMLFSDVQYTPLNPGNNASLPNATLEFWLSRTSGALQLPATIYQDGYLQTPFGSNIVTANSAGQFSPIYLDPAIPLRVQLFDQYGHLQMDVDPYIVNGRFQGVASVPTSPVDEQTSNTQLTFDPYLSVNLPAAGTYRYELYGEFVLSSGSGTNPKAALAMYLQGGTSHTQTFDYLAPYGGLIRDVPFLAGSGYGLAPNISSASTFLENYSYSADWFADPASSGTVFAQSAAYSTSNIVSTYDVAQSATTHTPLRITGIITVNGPCTLGLAWAQSTSSTVSLILVPGSYLKVENQDPTIAATIVTGGSGQPPGALSVTVTPSTDSEGTDSTTYTTTTSFAATATGGSGSYSYSWGLSGQENGTGTPTTGSAAATTVGITGMTAGDSYTGTLTCTVTDTQTGVQGQGAASITVACNAALSLTYTVTSGSASVTTTSTSDSDFVALTGSASGGGGTYAYTQGWSVGGSKLTVNSPSSAVSSISASGMMRGYLYTGTVKCTVTDQYDSSTFQTQPISVACQLIETGTTVTLGTLQNSRTGVFYTGYWTAAHDPSGNDEAAGLMSDSTDENGNTIVGMYAHGTSFMLSISATLAQTYFSTATFNGITLTSATASFTASGGVSTWTWTPSTLPWAPQATGTVDVTSP